MSTGVHKTRFLFLSCLHDWSVYGHGFSYPSFGLHLRRYPLPAALKEVILKPVFGIAYLSGNAPANPLPLGSNAFYVKYHSFNMNKYSACRRK
jgi:hypothetical protein